MHPLEILPVLLFLIANPWWGPRILKLNPAWWGVCWVSALPYFAILFINISFPYTYPYPRNGWVTGLALLIVGAMAGLIYWSFKNASLLVGRDGVGNNQGPGAEQRPLPGPNRRAAQSAAPPVAVGPARQQSPLKAAPAAALGRWDPPIWQMVSPRPAALLLAWIAVALLLIELYINPRITLTSDLLANREMFGQSTIVGTVGKLFSGAALFLLQTAWTRFLTPVGGRATGWGLGLKGLGPLAFHALPYLLLSGIYLVSGNRQFIFLGVVLVALTYLFRFGVGSIFRPVFISGFCVLLLAGVGYQFFRNKDSAGQQDVFLRYVINLTEKEWNPISDHYALNSSGMLLFTYYGIQFNTLSALIDGDIKYEASLMGTLPIVYRRLQRPLGLKEQTAAMADASNAFESQLDSFGGVWTTAFGSFYVEYGWFSFFGYVLLAGGVVVVVGKFQKIYPDAALLGIGLCAVLVFGVHYIVTFDNFGVMYLVMLLTPGPVWLKRQ
jgi:hypothetical protein